MRAVKDMRGNIVAWVHCLNHSLPGQKSKDASAHQALEEQEPVSTSLAARRSFLYLHNLVAETVISCSVGVKIPITC